MPTALTHIFVAGAGSAAGFRRPSVKLVLVGMLCSAGLDLDVGLHRYGVAYGDAWGHRGMTHSLFFALVLSVGVVTWLFRREAPFLRRAWWGHVLYFFLVTASHGFLDAFTNGGLGIAFFAPFDDTRYFMPWTPIPVSHFGLRSMFTAYGAKLMLSEIAMVWVPVALAAGAVWLVRLNRR